MPIKKSTVLLVVLALALSAYAVTLAHRLDRDLAPPALDLAVTFLVLTMAYLEYRNVLNPISLLAPLLLAHFFYTYQLSLRQDELSFSVEASYYLFIGFYIAGCLIPLKVQHGPSDFMRAKFVRKLATWTVVAAIVVVLGEAILNGGFPLALLFAGNADVYGELRFIPVAHYAVMLTALVPAMYYYAYKTGNASRTQALLGSAVVAMILLNTLSRQVMIFALIAFAITYARLNRINQTAFFLKAGAVIGAFFLLFGAVRTATDDELQLVEYLKAFSDVPEHVDVNTAEVTFNLYTSMNLGTLNEIHEGSDKLFWGLYTFRPLVELLRLDEGLDIAVPEDLDTFRLLGTILADPYLDFGLPGVALFGLMYGLLGMLLYKLSSRNTNPGYTLMWATFSFAMLMAVFANFFNVLFTWLCFGYCALLSRHISRLERRIEDSKVSRVVP
jgi:oligosaccharide repeat unit polymerase